MSVNDEALQPSSDSFWEVDCYKRTVKRQDDGMRLCNDLMTLMQERADIEKHYAKSLKAWSKKWGEAIDKGPEYGTTEAAWKATLTSADSVAALHLQVKEDLLNDVVASIKQWRSEHFHKPVVGPCKETKSLEDEFRKAQKPWAKRLSKVLDAKKKYHAACKLDRSAALQESNARGDSTISPDQITDSGSKSDPKQLKKIQEKAEKTKKDVETTKERYEAALNDLNAYNAKYMEDMTEVFQRSQESEEKRLRYFREMLIGMHNCLDLSRSQTMMQIYDQFHATVSQAEANLDLKWWSQNHGVDMAMHWPCFEEYNADFHTISRKEKKSGATEGITITSIRKSESTPHPQALQAPQQTRPQSQVYNNHGSTATKPPPVERQPSYDSQLNPFDDEDQSEDRPLVTGPASSPRRSRAKITLPKMPSNHQNNQNPFGDDEWEDEEPEVTDEGSGVMVRALYEYVGQEDDELSFKVGEVFVKLKDRDEQGWCTGRVGGRVGLFPDNYVEPTPQ